MIVNDAVSAASGSDDFAGRLTLVLTRPQPIATPAPAELDVGRSVRTGIRGVSAATPNLQRGSGAIELEPASRQHQSAVAVRSASTSTNQRSGLK